MLNARYKNSDQNISFVRIKSESDSEAPILLHVDLEDLDSTAENKETKGKRNSCDSFLDQNESVKKNERVQFITLFSVIILFIICNIPRIILLLHQVIIIDQIK